MTKLAAGSVLRMVFSRADAGAQLCANLVSTRALPGFDPIWTLVVIQQQMSHPAPSYGMLVLAIRMPFLIFADMRRREFATLSAARWRSRKRSKGERA